MCNNVHTAAVLVLKEKKEEIVLKSFGNNFYILQTNSPFDEIELYNMLGEKIKHYVPLSNQCKIDLSSFDSGIYFLSGKTANKLFNLKIIKR